MTIMTLKEILTNFIAKNSEYNIEEIIKMYFIHKKEEIQLLAQSQINQLSDLF